MIDHESIRAVADSRLDGYAEHFGKPLYDTYCFSQLPQTVFHLLTGQGERGLPGSVFGGLPDQQYERVIVLWLDAFGWRFFEQYADQYPFLKRFLDQGSAAKLTTQFPSTTAAHTTTLHTGLPVGESGVYEWFYYEPKLDRVIAPLLFSFAGDKQRDTLTATGVTPAELYPTTTLYQRLAAAGIESHLFQHSDIAHSPFTEAVSAGAHIHPYKTHAEACVTLTRLAARETGYFFLYIDTIDSIAHRYGPGSAQFNAEVDVTLTTLEKWLHGGLGASKNTLLIVTADHGQIEVDPKQINYLNRLDPSLVDLFKVNRAGDPIVPAGSPRDMFLHIKSERMDEAQTRLRTLLDGRAEVFRTRDLIDQGLFGARISETFLGRVGDLLILPYAHQTVWWYVKDKFEPRFLGSHGGLSRQEMETIFLALAY